MSELRCAWCRNELDATTHGHSFCSPSCQRKHEDWCRDHALSRRAAVSRWRNESAWDQRPAPEQTVTPPVI